MGTAKPATPSTKCRPPSVDEIVDGLRRVLRTGIPIGPDQAPDGLLALRGVRARAIDHGDRLSCVKALNLLLLALLGGLGEAEEAQALQILFAARATERGLTLTERRMRAARVGNWDYELTHFRKRVEPRLLREFAWLLHQDSQNYTPRTRYAPPPTEASGDTPGLTPADVNEQEELVSRIWSLVYGLRAEIIRRALLEESTPRDDDALADVNATCLWLVARLLARIHEYLERYGDRILHGDAEFRAESLIRLAGWRHDLSEEDARVLRHAVARAGESDQRAFSELIRQRQPAGVDQAPR